ncbi:MAG TPA: ribosome recycling factor [Chloroflexota bacterium]|nr:ribosome recycling factor [Chloroflexota bacterium]
MQDVVDRAEAKMKASIEALRKELTSIRTGRASPGLVDHLHVDYYGTETPLNQLANISVPEARTLIIQPYDRGAMAGIEKAILKSELGLTPNNDGQVIRLMVPRLTEERRKDLVKVVRKQVEDGRVAVRNVRREAMDHFKEMEKAKALSADEDKRAQERLQKLTDTYIKQIDDVGHAKEAEVMEV